MPSLEEYQAKISSISQSPDTSTEILLSLQDDIAADLAALETEKAKITEHEKKIDELKTINQKLFLRTTAPAQEQMQSETTSEDALAAIMGIYFPDKKNGG